MRLPAAVTLDELARASGARVSGDPPGGGDAGREIMGFASLEGAEGDELAFARSPDMRERALGSRAGALLVGEDFGPLDRPGLVAENVDVALSLIGGFLIDRMLPAPEKGVHPSALVGEGASVAEGASVGPFAVLEDGVSVGERARIGAGACIGRGASIGEDTIIHPNVTVLWGCRIGARCVVHPGAVVGSDGFGFARDADGSFRKMPQLGIVVVEDDVEIGACTCIDRATLEATVIARGVKLDNLVQIAHNVTVGPGTVMAAQVGIAGSSRIGAGCMFGGQAGAVDHVSLGDGCRLGAKCAATKSFGAGRELWGVPARERSRVLREMAFAARAEKLVRRLTRDIDEVRARLGELEHAAGGGAEAQANKTTPATEDTESTENGGRIGQRHNGTGD